MSTMYIIYLQPKRNYFKQLYDMIRTSDLNISKSKFFKSRKNDLINCLILGIISILFFSTV